MCWEQGVPVRCLSLPACLPPFCGVKMNVSMVKMHVYMVQMQLPSTPFTH